MVLARAAPRRHPRVPGGARPRRPAGRRGRPDGPPLPLRRPHPAGPGARRSPPLARRARRASTPCWSAAARCRRRWPPARGRPASACVTTYGMSETCGGCVYDGVPLDGVDVALADGTAGSPLGGAVLFSGYRGRPDLTAEALVDGRLRTADRARLGRDGRLVVLGRVDDVVVSGGLNVDLAEVERRLRSLARAWRGADVAVVGVPRPGVGHRGRRRRRARRLVRRRRRRRPGAPACRAARLRDARAGSSDSTGCPAPAVARSTGSGCVADLLAGPTATRRQETRDHRDRPPDARGQWLEGARPRTLPAAAVARRRRQRAGRVRGRRSPRCAAAARPRGRRWPCRSGVNYANDYSDGIRGTDADRVGPAAPGRLRPGRARAPSQRAAFASLRARRAWPGLVLVLLTGHWWLLAVGAPASLAAWYYTGGRRPYGYRGLGEVFVFVFFGLVAVCGTGYVQTGRVCRRGPADRGLGRRAACAILVANNLRDLDGDRAAGKLTLATRLGRPRHPAPLRHPGPRAPPWSSSSWRCSPRSWALLGLAGLLVTLPGRPAGCWRGPSGRDLDPRPQGHRPGRAGRAPSPSPSASPWRASGDALTLSRARRPSPGTRRARRGAGRGPSRARPPRRRRSSCGRSAGRRRRAG